jgi:hypothetical protein
MIEYVGWMGAICLSLCGVPLAVQAIREPVNISKGFLWLWGVGEILSLVYGLYLGVTPIIFNYAINLLCISIITIRSRGVN